jgi:ribosome-associated protein
MRYVGACSSAVEHGAHNPLVAGSIPAGPTKLFEARRTILRVTDSTTTPHDDIALSRALAVDIADIIAETPAADTRVIDIHETSSIADVFVICSGENERQLRAIYRSIVDEMGDAGQEPLRTEGDTISGWMLIDFGDVVVHVFDKDLREFYDLEGRWENAPVILAIQ